MKNQKLENFFKTLFFRKNYGYLIAVILFWYFVIFIILTLSRHFFLCGLSPVDKFIGGITGPIYTITYISSDTIYSILGFDFLFGNGECEGSVVGMPSAIILFFIFLSIIFLINFIIVENYKISQEKKKIYK